MKAPYEVRRRKTGDRYAVWAVCECGWETTKSVESDKSRERVIQTVEAHRKVDRTCTVNHGMGE